jgi:hypothetical protein
MSTNAFDGFVPAWLYAPQLGLERLLARAAAH